MYLYNKVCCIECKQEINYRRINVHYQSKSCLKASIGDNCPYCDQYFQKSEKANHVRWCEKNPKREYYNKRSLVAVKAMNEARQKLGYSNQFTKAKLNDLPIPAGYWKDKKGTFAGKTHTQETKDKIRDKALNNDYQRVCKSSHEYIDKRGRRFTFDSSWEDAMADRLDFLDINWIRPEPIKYQIDGNIRRYYADFYLPEYDLYLDPKNEYCRKQQKRKLDIVSKMINLIIIESIEDCKNWYPLEESNLMPSTQL